MSGHLRFDNSYARLPDRFFAPQLPAPASRPSLIAVNDGLARRLGIDPAALTTPEAIGWLAGNGLPDGAAPIAQAYAGHQFGNFNPQLGDGRAVLLGEIVAPDDARYDLVLKGAGRTPYSRNGDGRAWLGPVLREYLMSEAMAALGVPTTRALAAVTTGDVVWREAALPGAVLARVGASHVRIGTFQYFAARGDHDAVAVLADHVRARHFPQTTGALGLLSAIIAAQARLIAHWMALGFIHGVMNTDNMAVSGETIDYGPCAFMDVYHPATVFSSIDRTGRYAYANQPQIALWNLAQLARCLLPLIGNGDAAIALAEAALAEFAPCYQAAWLQRFGAKIGLAEAQEDDRDLIESLLQVMADSGADFSSVFRGLSDGTAADAFDDPTAFAGWRARWSRRLDVQAAARTADPDPQGKAGQGITDSADGSLSDVSSPAPTQPQSQDVNGGGSWQPDANARAIMARANPALIPRTHRIEAAITAAAAGDFDPFHRLRAAWMRPFAPLRADADLTLPPLPEERIAQTFCGT